MNDTANPSGADTIAVTDVDSAAQALMQREQVAEQPEEVIEEEVEVEATEVAEAETEEESEEYTDDSPETEDDESDEREAEEESEDPQFHSVDELAEALELSPEDFKNQITAKVKVNGEEKEVNLAELAKGYQLESDYRQKTMDLADNRRAFEEESQAIKNELGTRLQEATNIVATLEQSIMGEYNSIDWNTLRTTDPAEYAALQTDYENRYKSIQQLKAQAANANQQLQSEQMAKQQEQLTQRLQKESEALVDLIPEWKDASVAKQEKAEMRDFLKQYKFTDDEIANLADHRIVLMIRDAQKGKKVATKKDVALKKVVKAPKLQKSGSKPSKQTIQKQKFKDLKARVRKTGHVDDVAALLLARS